MRHLGRRVDLVVIGIAGIAGIGLGHVLEYVALAPDSHHRGVMLAETGHHYLPTVFVVVAYLAVVAGAVRFLAGVRRGVVGRHSPSATTPAGDWTRVLPLAQALAFTALEVGERVLAQAPLSDLGRVLLLGLPVQVVVGLVVASLLAALARAGEQIGLAVAARRARRRPRPPADVSWRPALSTVPPASLSRGTTPARGPPLLVAVAA